MTRICDEAGSHRAVAPRGVRPAGDLAIAQRAAGAIGARPGPWGNPFTIADVQDELGLDKDAAQAEAVGRYGRWVRGEFDGPKPPPSREKIRAELAGKNLACWCREGSPCHVDTLLRLANEP